MENEEIINVFYGELSIKIPKNSNFFELKQKIFYRDLKLVKFFSFNGKKIAENLRVYNYPEFLIAMDKGKYIEFTKGKYRCKKCRKYVKISKMICNHLSKCRIFHNFKKKEPMTEQITAGYKEEVEEEENEEEIDEEEIDKEVNDKINSIFEKHKKYMLKRINEILYDDE